LPANILLPRDIRDKAFENAVRSAVVTGPVTIENIPWVAPLWRPLLNALCRSVPVEWHAPAEADTSWFEGIVRPAATVTGAVTESVSCADPHHETIEALRWARELVCKRGVAPADIAIASPATEAWDQHFLALACETGLKLHFSHGIPALSTRDGQRCAALADVLLRGVSAGRIRRLSSLCAGQGTVFDHLPDSWLRILPRGSALHTSAQWKRVLTTSDTELSPELSELLSLTALMESGPRASAELSSALLRGRSLEIWNAATRNAPIQAIELSLQNIRLPDDNDPGDSIVWCPASHAAGVTRPWVRLLGLTARAWPRAMSENPILPRHVLSGVIVDADPATEADRRNFHVLVSSARSGIVFSRSRRTQEGSRVGPSPLLPQGVADRVLSRARIPEHAFSEPDRLMARPLEAGTAPMIASATRCWQDWHSNALTDHDGRFQPDHPVIAKAVGRIQSATSLRLLLRAPLGFVWRYAFDWRAPEERRQPLTITSDDMGRLVHELLRRAVDTLEGGAGFWAAREADINAALDSAALHVRESWPLETPVPPLMLWHHTVAYASKMGAVALRTSETTQADTRSWTEVPFGGMPGIDATRVLPWDAAAPVVVTGTDIRIQGSIDRLDLRVGSAAVRVTDYKTGERPRNAERMVIRGGAELQRTLYALACRQLLPECHNVNTRLVYLSDPPLPLRLNDLDSAVEQIGHFVALASGMLQKGTALPGPQNEAAASDLRLAMPASPGYMRRKGPQFHQLADRLAWFWDRP
jgi:hypothetical protein